MDVEYAGIIYSELRRVQMTFTQLFFLKKHLQSFADLWPTLMGF
jgi:hypothetical protein